ncbi:hypothetical protein AGDE_16749 [Angomonas deanei]|nr:hypothetical protein AGDE_16749 [Angomonas deanei]|eukprot:EPY16287.1 hypothetical protein AGDE_16749 [Angomonas deanei]
MSFHSKPPSLTETIAYQEILTPQPTQVVMDFDLYSDSDLESSVNLAAEAESPCPVMQLASLTSLNSQSDPFKSPLEDYFHRERRTNSFDNSHTQNSCNERPLEGGEGKTYRLSDDDFFAILHSVKQTVPLRLGRLSSSK